MTSRAALLFATLSLLVLPAACGDDAESSDPGRSSGTERSTDQESGGGGGGEGCTDTQLAFAGTWRQSTGEESTIEVTEGAGGCTATSMGLPGVGEFRGDELHVETTLTGPCQVSEGDSTIEITLVLRLEGDRLLGESTSTATGCGADGEPQVSRTESTRVG